MALSRQIKPITHLQANPAEVLRTLAREKEPGYNTQNGEAGRSCRTSCRGMAAAT